MRQHFILLLLLFSILSSCSKKQADTADTVVEVEVNPAAEGFDAAGSDSKAIELADKIMVAQGGRKNWDQERFFTWNFFGRRSLWWDKLNGDVRIQMHNEDSTVILVNIFNDTGRVFKSGEEITQADSVTKYVQRGKGMWINDSYWLFMPYKLKDSGVTLKYVKEDTTQSGQRCDILELTFKDVGNTPQNKYQVWVDKSDNLIKQWAFYRSNDMEEPNFITPWEKYEQFGSLLLACNRGEREITDVKVVPEMDAKVFTTL